MRWVRLEVWDADVATTDDPLGAAVIAVQPQLLAGAGAADAYEHRSRRASQVDLVSVVLPLGRQQPKQPARGSLSVALSAERPQRDALPLSPPVGAAGSSAEALQAVTAAALAEAAEFRALLAAAAAAPLALALPVKGEELEACARGVALCAGGAATFGDLYVSNARLLFAPRAAAAPANACGPPPAPTETVVLPLALLLKTELLDTGGGSGGGGGGGGGGGASAAVAAAALQLGRRSASEKGGSGRLHPAMRAAAAAAGGGSGGSLQLHVLPAVQEITLLFAAERHGSGPSCLCAQLHRRLDHHLNNAEGAAAQAAAAAAGGSAHLDGLPPKAAAAAAALAADPAAAAATALPAGCALESEWARMRVTERGWRVTAINQGYELCETYPTSLVVPAAVTDDALSAAAAFRSKGRVPALTWLHPLTGAAVCRSAQPLAGISISQIASRHRNAEDERLVAAIAAAANAAAGGHRPFLIVDCRSRVAATGNAVMGKGTENELVYADACSRSGGARVVHLDIANIHAVRGSYLRLHELLRSTAGGSKHDASFLSSLHDSEWLAHVASLLKGASCAAHAVGAHGRSLLVHCSDGWDRTAQISILVQLLLDPHYRTLDGLAALLQKDLLAFGHKCAERLGHAAGGPSTHEWSPIVLQLLDAIHQVMAQQPAAFDFTDDALTFIAAHAHAGIAPDFRHDHERGRAAAARAAAGGNGPSVWALLLERRGRFANDGYREWPAADGALPVVCALQRLRLWRLFHQDGARLAASTIDDCFWCQPELDGLAQAEAEVEEEEGAPRCSVDITHTSSKKDPRGAEYTLYHLVVEIDEDDADETRTLAVARRFSEFVELDAQLRAAAPPAAVGALPPLPSSMTFNKLASNVVSGRRVALVRYVQAVMASAHLAHRDEVRAFLGDEAHRVQAVSGALN